MLGVYFHLCKEMSLVFGIIGDHRQEEFGKSTQRHHLTKQYLQSGHLLSAYFLGDEYKNASLGQGGEM